MSEPQPLTLKPLRQALLALHKALLEAERRRYERLHGRVEGAGRLLQLLLHDPWFAWLRPLSALVVQIDELLEAEEPPEPRALAALRDQVRTLLTPDEGGEGFGEQYHDALQSSPDVVLAHREVSRILNA
jgi:hypothetical protein